MNIPEKIILNNPLNWILSWNEWITIIIFESIFAVFDDKPPFLSILDTFWPIFGHFSYSTSINHSLTIELNNILNWITRVYFELNNILNWILGKAILNRILNESFFGKIQILNWIRLGIVHHYIVDMMRKVWSPLLYSSIFWIGFTLCHVHASARHLLKLLRNLHVYWHPEYWEIENWIQIEIQSCSNWEYIKLQQGRVWNWGRQSEPSRREEAKGWPCRLFPNHL